MPKSLDESLATLEVASIRLQKPEGPPQSPKGLGYGKEITYAYQSALQKLPIPDLQDTCRKYLDTVKPLHTPREHEETVAAVKEFLKTDGPELQERLKRYATTKASYIEQFWYDSYLHYDNRKSLRLLQLSIKGLVNYWNVSCCSEFKSIFPT